MIALPVAQLLLRQRLAHRCPSFRALLLQIVVVAGLVGSTFDYRGPLVLSTLLPVDDELVVGEAIGGLFVCNSVRLVQILFVDTVAVLILIVPRCDSVCELARAQSDLRDHDGVWQRQKLI